MEQLEAVTGPIIEWGLSHQHPRPPWGVWGLISVVCTVKDALRGEVSAFRAPDLLSRGLPHEPGLLN